LRSFPTRRSSDLDRVLDRLAVHHRQAAGKPQAQRRDLRVRTRRLGTRRRRVRGVGEHLGGRRQLDVHLETEHRLEQLERLVEIHEVGLGHAFNPRRPALAHRAPAWHRESMLPDDAVDAAPATVGHLAERARRLADARGGRVLVGIAGAPGAGKSTLAEALVAELGVRAALVPMDGFHYSQQMLGLLGRAERKGAADTFDADGLAALLHRIRTATGDVYAPTFDRSIEEPIAAGTVVPADADIVVVEGNYLLLDDGAWAEVRAALDEAWFLRIPQATRVERL